ncbi:MAG: hypothetical protein HPY50_02400 [Firmicutes bacterium]|nr:hypothetical protein [Bacillota bacterium]
MDKTKPYWFRLNEPQGLKEYLNSLNGTERSNYIRSALMWYWRFGDLLDSIDQKLDQVLKVGISCVPPEAPAPASGVKSEEPVESELDDDFLEASTFAIITGSRN